MFSLIVGGAASGKSAYAENLCLSLEGRRVYVATMEPWDEECRARIARHRARRADFGFQMLECYRDLAGLVVPAQANVLLDCLGNLIANELYGGDDTINGPAEPINPTLIRHVIERVTAGALRLSAQCQNLTIVTNEVCLAGTRYEGDTLPYLHTLARTNRALAAKADYVCEVACGLPNVLKGTVPSGGVSPCMC